MVRREQPAGKRAGRGRRPPITRRLARLTAIAREMRGRLVLEQMLQHIADGAAELLGVTRTSLRLLDPGGTRLIAVCRAGSPLHRNPHEEFRLGEGLVGWIAEHLEPLRLSDAQQDQRFVLRPGLRGSVGAFLGVPMVAGSRCMGVLSAVHPEAGSFDAQDEQLLVLLATIVAPHVEIARLARLSRVDSLTGALNRRGLDEAFPEVRSTVGADGEGAPVCVAMVDVDHFKRINDELGHAVGDEVLRAVVHRLATAMRQTDAIVRYGGEEFLLVLADVSLSTAARVAERARKAVEGGAIRAGDVDVKVTVSVGVVERRSMEARDAVLGRADAAMYRAKAAGRNRVQVDR